MKIYFLSPEDACDIFVKSPYFSLLQPLETAVRTDGKVVVNNNEGNELMEQAQAYYCANLLPFTEKEMEAISWFSKMVLKTMRERANRLIPKRWKFIKIRANMDWGFPYTMGKAIVLPEIKVREMVYAYCEKIPDLIVSSFKTIFHETVHLHQKANPILYQKIYHDAWGFKCVDPADIQYLPFYRQYHVTNPDSMRISYIIPIVQPGTNGRTDWFLPLLILDPEDVNRTKGILVKLAEVYNSDLGKYQYYTTEDRRTICSLRQYTEKFYGMTTQLYHPHEIMANLMTDYAITYKVWTSPSFSSVKFYDIIDRVMYADPSCN